MTRISRDKEFLERETARLRSRPELSEKSMKLLAKIESLSANVGMLRILFVLHSVKGEPMRYSILRDVSGIKQGTLDKGIKSLCTKGYIEVFRIDVKQPREQQKVSHYRLTEDGGAFIRLLFTHGIEFVLQNLPDCLEVAE